MLLCLGLWTDSSSNTVFLTYFADSNPNLFTIRVHFGGTFHLTPLREYRGGKVRIIDQIQEDYFNITDLDVIAVGAGYKLRSLVMYLYKVPGESLDNGLRPLQTDEHVVDFLYHSSYQRFMDIYMDDTPMRNITCCLQPYLQL